MPLTSIVRRVVRKVWYDKRHTRFHFIHIPKNGGRAVRDTLYFQRDVSLSTPFHYRYIDIADSVGRHLRYFAIVRNPWSRTASRYQFARERAASWPASDPRRQFIASATFDEFVRQRKMLPIPKDPGQPWMGPLSSWFNQLEWIRDERGSVVCDCLRMEKLDEDLPAYLGRSLRLNQRNVARSRQDYRAMYNDELAGIIEHVFREDIDHFGFTFDGPATRNTFAGG